MARQRYESKAVLPVKERTTNRREKWEVLTGWHVTDSDDDTGIEAWNKRRIQRDSKPAEQRKIPLQPWEPFLCQTVKNCDIIEDLESYINESLANCLKSKQKPNARKPREAVVKGSSNVEIYAQVKAEHEKQLLDETQDTARSTCHERTLRLVEEDDCAKKGRAKTAINAGDATQRILEGSNDKRCTTAIGIREEKQIGSSKKEVVISRTKRELASVRIPLDGDSASEEVQCSCSGTLDASDANGNLLKGKLSSSDSSIGAEDKKVPKLSYTQSNIKLKYINSRHSSPPFDTVGYSRVRNRDETNFRDFVRTGSGAKGVREVASDTGRQESETPPSGIMVTAIEELRERCTSKADGKLVDVGTRSRPSTNSDDDKLSKYRTMSGAATLGHSRSPMSHYSATLSDEDPRHSPNQYGLTLSKANHMDTEQDKEKGLTNFGYSSIRTAQTQTNGKTSDYALDLSSLLTSGCDIPSRPKASSTRDCQGNSAKSSHLFPIGDLLPAVDRSLWSNMAGSRSFRLKERRGETSISLGRHLTREFTITGRDKLLPYEDTIIMMREGVELVRLRERHQTFLGPPAFRPARARTPLSRAKDFANKRLYGQFSSLSQGEQKSDEGGSRTRWQSAAGTMYSRGTNPNADDTKPAPSTPTKGDGKQASFDKSRPSPAMPESTTLNSLYKLSRRRKGPDHTSSSASATSLNVGNVSTKLNSRMMDLIR